MILPEDIVAIHRQMPQAGGGPPKPGCLEEVLVLTHRACDREMSDQPEEDGFSYALVYSSLLGRFIASEQCFGDGNTRAGWLALLLDLRQRGLTLSVTPQEGFRVFKGFAQNPRASLYNFLFWLLTHTQEAP